MDKLLRRAIRPRITKEPRCDHAEGRPRRSWFSSGPAELWPRPAYDIRPAAITKARGWIDDIRVGAIGSFAEIAEREAQGERHIRLLAPLAFLSPRIIAAIVDGTAPADLTVTGLAKALPYSWAEQEERVGLSL
jgi:site-specific DNA recombinase